MPGSNAAFSFASEGELRSYLEQCDRQWQSQIQGESANYLLQANEEQYVQHLTSAYTLDVPEIAFDDVFATMEERNIPAERFPRGMFFNVRPGASYPKPVFTYHLPYSGNADLFRYQASRFTLSGGPRIFLKDGCICFELVSFTDTAEDVRLAANSKLSDLRQLLGFLADDIKGYNARLEERIRQTVGSRKQIVLQQQHMLGSLGVPIRLRNDTPETFSVPAKRQPRRIVFQKPQVKEQGFTPEPTIDSAIYGEILQIIHDAGRNLERLPSTYKGKSEEDLRDYLIITLEPHFRLEGSVTGETFNKTGKTDILIRWQNSNVFVAECKYWGGEKRYLDTITQLLGYLTWRDSKAAVIIFDRNKEVSTSLQVIQTKTPSHPNYLGLVDRNQEGWFGYRFHIIGDSNREVQLAVLVFHLPSSSS